METLRSEVNVGGVVGWMRRHSLPVVVVALLVGVAGGLALALLVRDAAGPPAPEVPTRRMTVAGSGERDKDIAVESTPSPPNAAGWRSEVIAGIGAKAGDTAVAVGADGSTWVAFSRCRFEPCREAGLGVATKTDGGWSGTQVAEQGVFDFDLVVGDAGEPIVAWASVEDWTVHAARRLPSGELDQVVLPGKLGSNADQVELLSIQGRVYLVVMSRSLHVHVLDDDVWREVPTPALDAARLARLARGEGVTTDGRDLFILYGESDDKGKTRTWQVRRYSPAAGAWDEPIALTSGGPFDASSLLALGKGAFCLAGAEDHHLLLACGGASDLWKDRRLYPSRQVYGEPVLAVGAGGEPLVLFDHWSNQRLLAAPARAGADDALVYDAQATGISAAGAAIAFTSCDASGCYALFGERAPL